MGNTTNKMSPDLLKPRGIYPDGIQWDQRVVKKMVSDKKVAPFFEGSIDCDSVYSEECPICFLYYTGGLNRSRCCKNSICTECYLKIKPSGSIIDCPFCNSSNYQVMFTGPLTQKEVDERIKEEEAFTAAQEKMRNEEIERDRKREEEKRKNKAPEHVSESETSSEYIALDPDDLAKQGYSPEEIEQMLVDEAIRISLKNNY
eukprot:TRINITY_DN9155_c0_g1_i1.p1 TRINITY_DN9155_c0_g1~~TRINITY_DN9155_c0_g1_i1.p1  ORF type:complete len:209 (+),score=50.66 TRINITY_DN9155_c0_g1_i1:24-629(+)